VTIRPRATGFNGLPPRPQPHSSLGRRLLGGGRRHPSEPEGEKPVFVYGIRVRLGAHGKHALNEGVRTHQPLGEPGGLDPQHAGVHAVARPDVQDGPELIFRAEVEASVHTGDFRRRRPFIVGHADLGAGDREPCRLVQNSPVDGAARLIQVRDG
jgi:hypothetical protein